MLQTPILQTSILRTPVAQTIDAEPPIQPRSDRLRAGEAVLSVLRGLPEIELLMDGCVASWHSSIASIQSRRWHRRRFERELSITPLDHKTQRPSGDEFTVVGHDISLTGLSFVHHDPLASRLVAVAFSFDDGNRGSVNVQLRWCRYRGERVFQSGGQFVRAVNAPHPPAAIDACG